MGTAKSMGGVLAKECYEQAKNEGCKVEIVWQDGDSSAAKSISLHHPAGKVYKCGGHVGRAELERGCKEEGVFRRYEIQVHRKIS